MSATVAALALLTCVLALALADQKRTEADLNAVVSAYLSDGILHDVHDWGSGQSILIVLQREAQQPGMWRMRWLYPFDKRYKFSTSSFVTRSSFTLSNALPNQFHLSLRLPAGVNTVEVDRSDLEQADSSSKFQARYPNNVGYIAISRAGFNADKTEAIFYLDHFCG